MALCKIGTTQNNMVTLRSLGIPEPKPVYRTHSGPRLELPNGHVRDMGRPAAIWRWGFLTQALRGQLRAFCSGSSADVYIQTRTLDNLDEYKTFRAVMWWPAEEETDAWRRIDFEIEFRFLEAV